MLSELIPAKRRGRYIALMDGFWPLGFVAAGVLSYFLLPVIGWRDIFLVLAIPAVFVLAIRFFIPESPRWLEQAGRHEAADKVLLGIEQKVRDSWAAPTCRSRSPCHASRVRRGRFLRVPATMVGAIPPTHDDDLECVVLRPARVLRADVVVECVVAAIGFRRDPVGVLHGDHFPGRDPRLLMAAWLVERWGRKPVCVVTLLGGGVMAFLYGQSAVFGGNVGLLITSGLLMQFFLFGMWAVLYTYTPELYPTSARATGSGFASAIGRVGSLLGPLVTGLVFPITGQGGVFALGALCFAVAALVVWVFGMETKGKTLEELTQA